MKTVKLAGALLPLLLAGCATTSIPETTYDGLELVPDARFGDQVYRLPGADLSSYDALGLEDCEVAFRKNWLREQNRVAMDLSSRVTQRDVDRIRDALAEACDATFREALLREPGYELVDDFDDGEPVLVLRPRIVDLDVTAPDVGTSSMSRTYVASAGEMTLVLEAVDGTTGQVLARAIDRQRARESAMRLEWTNSVSNRAEATRILKRWAERLREAVDAVVTPED